jgi:hypothetical protein
VAKQIEHSRLSSISRFPKSFFDSSINCSIFKDYSCSYYESYSGSIIGYKGMRLSANWSNVFPIIKPQIILTNTTSIKALIKFETLVIKWKQPLYHTYTQHSITNNKGKTYINKYVTIIKHVQYIQHTMAFTMLLLVMKGSEADFHVFS